MQSQKSLLRPYSQILTWALFLILRGGGCSERVRSQVRRAYREVVGVASLTPVGVKACLSRLYNRLNEDYKPLHALCRFFIEHTVPDHNVGDHGMLPFLIKMSRLYEMFVAEWVRKRGIPGMKIRTHERIRLGPNDEVEYDIDMLLVDAPTGRVVCVVDAKYKDLHLHSPSHDDINQVVACAVAYQCSEAVLVYPIAKLPRPFEVQYPGIRVRALAFSTDGALDENGERFVEALVI